MHFGVVIRKSAKSIFYVLELQNFKRLEKMNECIICPGTVAFTTNYYSWAKVKLWGEGILCVKVTNFKKLKKKVMRGGG